MQFQFGDYTMDADRRELHRAGDAVHVEPQVFDLILHLIRNRDRVVSKDDLLASVWGGRIVSESTLSNRINAARRALGDSGEHQQFIKTIARRGIRFVGDVREQFRPVGNGGDARPNDRGAEPLPPLVADRPSIAVLPFENLSEDRGLELITGGLAEDIIALLARVPGFFVIARASSFVYVQHAIDIRKVGAELGVRYVVTGSARSSEGRVRITVQLNETESSNQLWAGRYDVERGDTLDLQDEIVRQIMGELEPALTRADLQLIRRRRINSVDAWSHFRQAVGVVAVQGLNEDSLDEARRLLRQAVAIDADFALARGFFAALTALGSNLSLIHDTAAERDAKEEAERAVAIDPNASEVLGYAGCALTDVGERDRGYTLLQRAVELDPSNALAHVLLGAALVRSGRFDDGIKSMQYGMRSSPKDFRLTFWSMILADALVHAGRLEEAFEVASTASLRDGRLYGARVVSARVLKKLNRLEEARAALAEARRIRPALSLDEIRRFFGGDTAADLAMLWT